jgi:hypothetical protein
LELSSNNLLGDVEIDILRQRLLETEAVMERIISKMGNVERLSPTILAQVLKSQGVCAFTSLFIIINPTKNTQKLHSILIRTKPHPFSLFLHHPPLGCRKNCEKVSFCDCSSSSSFFEFFFLIFLLTSF